MDRKNQRLEAFTALLKEGIAGPPATTQAQREDRLRRALYETRLSNPRARHPMRVLLSAAALLVSFALGRMSWRSVAGPEAPEAPKEVAASEKSPLGEEPERVAQDRKEPALTAVARAPIAPPPLRSVQQPRAHRSRELEAPKPRPEGPAAPNMRKGFRSLREGRFEEAAVAFAAVAEQGPTSIRPDAAFLNAVCLGRAGRPREAKSAFELYLELYPNHERMHEASVALGWLHLRLGDKVGAQSAFLVGRSARDRSVSAAAHRGLAALQRTPTEATEP